MPINFAVKLAVTVAMEAAQMGLQASKRTKGPRLDELTVTTSEYGTPLPRFLGTRKFATAIIHAEDLKEVEKTSKIKGGGKQTTYHYQATFAAAISDCEIDKVLKIWFDDKLVYDATGVGPISYASALGIDLTTVMRIYKGTETQLPDPRYESWCEDKYGLNSAPAYRGVAYLFFEDMPVDNFGNRIPQIVVLASSADNPAYLYETLTTAQSHGSAFAFSPSGDWAAYYSAFASIEWLDGPTRKTLGTSPAPGMMTSTGSAMSVAPDGTAYWVGDVIDGVGIDMCEFSCSPLGTPGKSVIAARAENFVSRTRALIAGETTDGIYTSYQDDYAGYIFNATNVASGDHGSDWCLDETGVVWMVSQPTGSSNHVIVTNLATGDILTIVGAVTRSTAGDARICYSEPNNHFFIVSDGHWYTVSKGPLTLTASGSISLSGPWDLPAQSPSHSTFWAVGSGYNEYSLNDGSLIRSLNKSLWLTSSDEGSSAAFDYANNAVWVRDTAPTSDNVYVRYIDRVAPSGTTLGAVVSKMCDAAGMTDYDASALTQTLAGYSWTRGDVKSQLEPVIDIHDVDARPHDFTVQFLTRGSAPSGTILTIDFAKSDANSPRYKDTIAQDTDLPVVLRVNFADTGFDQQTNNVLSPLPTDSVDSQRDATIDLTTYAASPAEAQQLADRYIRREWNSRETIENSLTAQCLALEPGDVTTLDLDGSARNVRLTKQTIAGGKTDCTFVRDETNFAAVNTAATGPSMDGREPSVIVFPSPVVGFVIDAPYREDSDQDVRPLLYAGAGSYADLTYPGAVIYEETGSGTSAAFDQLFDTVSSGATWGMCSGALASADPNLWDRGNTLTVSLQSGSLNSATEADINADPTLNLILIGSNATGWEYVNFTTATLGGDGSYTLSDFKRGRRGTEWMCNAHTSGESWVLASSLNGEEMGTDQVGGAFAFKAQSAGRSLSAAREIDVSFAGNTLKPYAPARIKWTTDGTDMFGEIIRRTRVGGSWVGGSTIPLSENSEAYSVDIYHSGVLKRTIAVTGTNLFTYAGAQITADGNSVGVPPSVHAYQLSDAVGRGFALAA